MVELLAELGGAVVLSSHVMEDVIDLADRVLILNDGTVVFDGVIETLAARAPGGGGRSAEEGFLSVLASSRGGV